MIISEFEHLLRMACAAAVCLALLGYAQFKFAPGDRRRWISAALGLTGVGLTIVAIVQRPAAYRDAMLVRYLIGAILACVAMGTLLVGWRGRRVGDHPYCRRCGFNLSGGPPESARCSECGAEIQDPRSIVFGTRQVRRGWMIGGVVLLLLSLGVVSGPAYQRVQQTNLNPYKPTSWLVQELSATDKETRDFAWDALKARLRLADAHSELQPVAEWIVADMEAGRWHDLFPDVLQKLKDRPELLDEAAMRRVMRQVPPRMQISLFREVPKGLPIRFGSGSYPGDIAGFHIEEEGVEDKVGEIVIPRSAVLDDESRGTGAFFLFDLGPLWDQVPLGTTGVTRTRQLRVTRSHQGKLLEEKITLSTTQGITIVAPDEPLSKTDPRPEVQSSVWSVTMRELGSNVELKFSWSGIWSRVRAHVWVVQTDGRTRIGMIDTWDGYRGRDYCQILADRALLPAKPFWFELVPNAVPDADDWIRLPILDQTITIKQVKR